MNVVAWSGLSANPIIENRFDDSGFLPNGFAMNRLVENWLPVNKLTTSGLVFHVEPIRCE